MCGVAAWRLAAGGEAGSVRERESARPGEANGRVCPLLRVTTVLRHVSQERDGIATRVGRRGRDVRATRVEWKTDVAHADRSRAENVDENVELKTFSNGHAPPAIKWKKQ